MDLEEGHCNAPPGQVSPKAFPAGIERVRLAGARLAIADDGGGLTGTGTGTGTGTKTGNGGRGSSGNHMSFRGFEVHVKWGWQHCLGSCNFFVYLALKFGVDLDDSPHGQKYPRCQIVYIGSSLLLEPHTMGWVGGVGC